MGPGTGKIEGWIAITEGASKVTLFVLLLSAACVCVAATDPNPKQSSILNPFRPARGGPERSFSVALLRCGYLPVPFNKQLYVVLDPPPSPHLPSVINL